MTRSLRVADLARLVRLPLVLSVLGDPIVGWVVAGGDFTRPGPLVGLALASACLYLGGMALNDWCDLPVDRTLHPGRVLPSGRIPASVAFQVAAGLLVAGVVIATFVHIHAGVGALAVVIAIVAYDAWLKRYAVAGCVAMGACRGLDVAMGAAALGLGSIPTSAIVVALAHVAYTAMVTAVSLLEERERTHRAAIAVRYAIGIAPVVAVAWMSHPLPAVPVIALLVVHLALALGATPRVERARVMRAVGAGVRGILLLDTAWLWAAGAWLAGGITLVLFAVSEVRARTRR